VLTPVSYKFDERITGKRKWAIYDYDLKCVTYDAVTVECPAPLPKKQRDELLALSLRAFKALGIRDLGRIDWRITEDGRIYFLEINALPSLEPGAGIYLSGALAGLGKVEDVLGVVIESAAKRQGLSLSSGPFARKSRTRCGFIFNVKRKAAKHAQDDDSEAEYDSEQTLDLIASAIAAQGVEVVRLEANEDLPRRLSDAKLDMAFNLGEGQHGRGRECHTPALLEMMRIPFTGSDSVTMALALDKALAKSVVRDAGVPTARSVVMKTGDEPIAGLVFPLLVKPNAEGSSKGVHPRSVVEDERALRETVHELIGKYGQDILVEEFLPGREFTVGLVGAQKAPRVLPPMEIVFVEPDSKHPIYAFGDKLDWTQKIQYDRPAKMDAALAREVEEAALGVWRALGCRDVARVDLRQDARGRVCFIECNPLPGLTPGWSDLCLIAESAGLTHQALIGEIMRPAFARLEKAKGR
jgi:D-alanine-D-alanine ligase